MTEMDRCSKLRSIMARLSTNDLALAKELELALATFNETSPPVLQTFVHDLRSYLGAEHAVSYAANLGDNGPFLDYAYISGFRNSVTAFRHDCNAWIHASGGRWALFDPVSPEPFQRNIVMAVGTFAQLVSTGRSASMDIASLKLQGEKKERILGSLARTESMFRNWHIYTKHQLRMLVCDGSVLLGWVGVFQTEPYTSRQVRLFQRIARSLRHRLIMEARMQSAPMYQAGLEAALDAIPRAAFIISERGTLLHANALARAMREQSRSATLDISAAIAGAAGYEVRRLEGRGMRTAYLVISSALPMPEDRLQHIQCRFGLTKRQAQVLRGLLAGHSNKRIAYDLGCSARTVEVHISKLLSKANVSCRAELVARVLG